MAKNQLPTPPGYTNGKNFAWIFLDNDAALARIASETKKVEKSGNATRFRTYLTAYRALKNETDKAARRAVDFSELLFCWHGTQVFSSAKGGAA